LISRFVLLVRKLWAVQYIRFLMVGGVNTIFGYGVFAALILLHLHYTLAALLSTICGVLFNFKTTGTLVFKNKSNRLIFRFFGVYLITYLLNIGLLKLFAINGVGSLAAQAILALPLATISFLLNRKFVFSSAGKTQTTSCSSSK
jgi:putative flippase GtrA